MASASSVFVSYARTDLDLVGPIVDELQKLGIETWLDMDELKPGDSWEHAISEALRKTQALLFFISPESVVSKWVVQELELALTSGVRVLPVVLRRTSHSQLPPGLQKLRWVDATRFPPETAARSTAEQIAKRLESWSPDGAPGILKDAEREKFAQALAAQTKGVAAPPEDTVPRSIFVVHGHDEELLHEVVAFVEGLGIKAIVLKDVEGAARSLLDKFFQLGGAARFAIVLISADDMGSSRIQFEEPEVGAKALKYRSRQNAILELGYFYGLLGWDKVFVLEKTPPRKFPDFERPSDLNGVVFDRYDTGGKWKTMVAQRLKNHGFIFENP